MKNRCARDAGLARCRAHVCVGEAARRLAWISGVGTLLIATCLSALPAAAETFPITARIWCPASLLADGTIDFNFTTAPTLVPCAGVRVTAMDADALLDEYCGAAYTDSQGRVNFTGECSDSSNRPDVYLKVEARSMLGFSVGTHDYTAWDALADLASLGASFGGTLPDVVVDYLRAHETYAWYTGERLGSNGVPLAFGDLAMGAAFDSEFPVSNFAARQFWANQYAMQRIRGVTNKPPMDFSYTVDAPLGSPTTVWDTVIVNEDNAINKAATTLVATPHEIGHVVHNTYHSVFSHWLFDAPDYMTNHSYCEQGHFMTLAWYEGFANWIRHVAYGKLDWTTNQLTLPSRSGTCGESGFNLEGNVTAVLDAIYFGPVTGRMGIDLNQFSCASGFARVQDAQGVVRCERNFAPTCASTRTRVIDGDGVKDTCERPGVEQMSASDLYSYQQSCAHDAANCAPAEAFVYSSCASPAVARRIAGTDSCRETRVPMHALPGGAPMPRGDGTPDRVVGFDSNGAQRWFPLADADTIIGWVQNATYNSHRMLEMWKGWARPWCATNNAQGFPRFCNSLQSPNFVGIVTPASSAPPSEFP